MSSKLVKLPPSSRNLWPDGRSGGAVHALIAEALSICLGADPSLETELAGFLSVWTTRADHTDRSGRDPVSDLLVARRMFVYAHAEAEAEHDHYLGRELELCIASIAARIEKLAERSADHLPELLPNG